MVARKSLPYDADMSGSDYHPVAMQAQTLSGFQIALIVVLVASLAVSAFRMARIARSLGRSPYRWFFISFFLTALPATLVFWRDQMKRMRASESLPGFSRRVQPTRSETDEPEGAGDSVVRCRHCGAVLDGGEVFEAESCPRCGMILEQERYA